MRIMNCVDGHYFPSNTYVLYSLLYASHLDNQSEKEKLVGITLTKCDIALEVKIKYTVSHAIYYTYKANKVN